MSGVLGMGAGAAKGLEELMTRMLLEDQQRTRKSEFQQESSRRDAAQAETTRSNMADEDYKRDDLKQRGDINRTNQQIREDAAADSAFNRKGINEDRDSARILGRVKLRPIGSQVPQKEYDEEVKANVPEGVYEKTPNYDQDFVGPQQPELAGKKTINFKGTNDQIAAAGKAAETKSKDDAMEKDRVQGLELRAEQAKNTAERAGYQNELTKAQTDLAKFKQTAGGSLPAASRSQAQNATNVMAHLDDIDKEIENVDKMGLLGPVGGRWADFLAGKVGSADIAASPEQQQALEEFRTDIGLLKSGMAMVHGGARGGGSISMVQRMDALINAATMNKPLLQGSLNSFRKWLKTYALQGDNPAGGAAQKAGGGGGVTITSIEEMK